MKSALLCLDYIVEAPSSTLYMSPGLKLSVSAESGRASIIPNLPISDLRLTDGINNALPFVLFQSSQSHDLNSCDCQAVYFQSNELYGHEMK